MAAVGGELALLVVGEAEVDAVPGEIGRQHLAEEGLVLHLLKESDKTMKKWAEDYNVPYVKEKWLPIVTKASVIQKEASSVADMPLVSSVIDNRIKKGMRLQMDGTLNYGEYSHQKVTARRIRTDTTPYNTYKNRGLPRHPVCNVSREAIGAALRPKQTDYLYFVGRNDGTHQFSRTLEEHNQAVRKYQRKKLEKNGKG